MSVVSCGATPWSAATSQGWEISDDGINMFRPREIAVTRNRYRGQQDPHTMDRATHGMNTWRARCGESRTSGSESGPQKPTSRNADSALRPDFYTEHWTGEGKLYLCTFKDVWSNRIVGYSIADRMTAGPAVAAISNAAALRDMAFAGVIVHTDRGSQFRSRKFVLRLKDQKMIGSMGRVGAAGDNAAAESFFSLQQTTCSIANDGQHATDYASRSSPGSKPPITADANNEASANSTPIQFEAIHQPALRAK